MCHSCVFFFFSSRRRHTRFDCDWSSDVCSSDLPPDHRSQHRLMTQMDAIEESDRCDGWLLGERERPDPAHDVHGRDRKSTRLNSSHSQISYAVFCLKKKTSSVAGVA